MRARRNGSLALLNTLIINICSSYGSADVKVISEVLQLCNVERDDPAPDSHMCPRLIVRLATRLVLLSTIAKLLKKILVFRSHLGRKERYYSTLYNDEQVNPSVCEYNMDLQFFILRDRRRRRGGVRVSSHLQAPKARLLRTSFVFFTFSLSPIYSLWDED